ncbi:MAG: hypothetical protein RJA80_762 [Actinomycetota bacterium]
MARFRSCKAAATTSAALAVPRSTITTNGVLESPFPNALKTSGDCPDL